jgi:hypothetical protein
MKHLKKFNESKDSDLDILKEYFYNIAEDLSDICELSITQNNDNYFTITIKPLLEIKSTITQDNTEYINDWITSNSHNSKILVELKSSISRLQEENILESFTLKKFQSLSNSDGYILEIYTKIKGDVDIENWIFLEEDDTVWVDNLRLKKFMNSKFGLEIQNYELGEDFDKYNERYIHFTINFNEPVQKSKLEEIKVELLKKELWSEDEGEMINIFDECYFTKHTDTSNYIMFVICPLVFDVR